MSDTTGKDVGFCTYRYAGDNRRRQSPRPVAVVNDSIVEAKKPENRPEIDKNSFTPFPRGEKTTTVSRVFL